MEGPKIIYGPKFILPLVITQMEYSGKHLVTLGHLMAFTGAKRPDLGLFRASNRLGLLITWPFGST